MLCDAAHGNAPEGVDGQLGYYLSGNSVPVGQHTWRSIQSSADCAVEAAESILAGATEAYALCRPPGHHAYTDLAGEFCYVNNAAVAAEHLRRRFARVSVLDVDVHHGNGTQGIFYHRRTCSSSPSTGALGGRISPDSASSSMTPTPRRGRDCEILPGGPPLPYIPTWMV